MTGFIASFLISTGILLAFTIPTFYFAWRKGRPKTIRRFLIAAGSIGLVLAVVAGSSQTLLGQCEAANGRSCVDNGSAGMQMTIMVLFVIVAWIKAVALYNE